MLSSIHRRNAFSVRSLAVVGGLSLLAACAEPVSAPQTQMVAAESPVRFSQGNGRTIETRHSPMFGVSAGNHS